MKIILALQNCLLFEPTDDESLVRLVGSLDAHVTRAVGQQSHRAPNVRLVQGNLKNGAAIVADHRHDAPVAPAITTLEVHPVVGNAATTIPSDERIVNLLCPGHPAAVRASAGHQQYFWGLGVQPYVFDAASVVGTTDVMRDGIGTDRQFIEHFIPLDTD